MRALEVPEEEELASPRGELVCRRALREASEEVGLRVPETALEEEDHLLDGPEPKALDGLALPRGQPVRVGQKVSMRWRAV